MSSISKAGIFIDVKQLLTFTYLMNKEMSVADRRDYGSDLVRYNLDMIKYFAMAFHIMPDRIHLKQRTINKAFDVAKSADRGKRKYFDSINSYLGLIKGTSDTKQATALLDSVQRKYYLKDYKNYKLIMK